jgi:hypothetical protein
MDLKEEDHKGKIPFSSSLPYILSTLLITVNANSGPN